MSLSVSTRRLKVAMQDKKMCLVRSEDVQLLLTEVAFLENLTDELAKECELLRKKIRVAVSHDG